MIPIAVFDCMVFVQALASEKGPARACYELVVQGRLWLAISSDVLAEVGEVLGRPALRRRLTTLTPERANSFLDDVIRHAEMQADVVGLATLPRDPKDEPYLNLAWAAGAAYLVTRDKDLLDLMGDPGFRAAHPGLTILDPVALLRVLAAPPASGP